MRFSLGQARRASIESGINHWSDARVDYETSGPAISRRLGGSSAQLGCKCQPCRYRVKDWGKVTPVHPEPEWSPMKYESQFKKKMAVEEKKIWAGSALWM